MIVKFICGHERPGQLAGNQPSDHLVREVRFKCPGCMTTQLQLKRAGLYTENDFSVLKVNHGN